MAGFTNAYQALVGDHIFRNQSLTPPATVYAGYSSSAGVECTDATYVRKAITFAAFNGTTGVALNSSAVTFDAQTASGNMVEVALFTAASSGTQMTDWKALTGGTQSIAAGQQPRIPAGSYSLTMD